MWSKPLPFPFFGGGNGGGRSRFWPRGGGAAAAQLACCCAAAAALLPGSLLVLQEDGRRASSKRCFLLAETNPDPKVFSPPPPSFSAANPASGRLGMDHGSMRIFTGNAHRELAHMVAEKIGITVSKSTVNRFGNGEVNVEIHESLRDCDVFVIQPTCNGRAGPQENLMELLVMLDTIRRSSAHRVTAVMPLFGYARQNAQDRSRSPITAKLVVDMLQVAGANRVVTVELHAPQVQGMASYPIDNLYAVPLLVRELETVFEQRSLDPEEVVVVSPDVGGAKRAATFGRKLKAPLAIFSRQRRRASEASEVDLVGEVDGKTCVIVDDIADSCQTLLVAAEKLKARGAKTVIATVIHGVLSGDACENVMRSQIDTLIVTDTIPMEDKLERCPKLRVVSIAPLIASAIKRLHVSQPLSTLWEQLPSETP